MAAPVPALFAQGSSQTDATTLTTEALAFKAKKLYLLQVSIRDTAQPSASITVTSLGRTWTLVGTSTANLTRTWLYRSQSQTDTEAPVTIINATADGNYESILWDIVEFSGVPNDSKNNGAGALGVLATNADTGAARTTLTNTVAALASVDSVVYSAAVTHGASTFTVDAGYYELADHQVANTAISQAIAFGPNDVASVWTFSSFRSTGMAIEVRGKSVVLQTFGDKVVWLNMDESDKDVLLMAENRRSVFRYEILDFDNFHRHWELNSVLSGGVTNNTFADIKRTASFTVKDSIALDWMADRIRPWMLVLAQEGRLNSRLITDNGNWSTGSGTQALSVTGDLYIEAIDIAADIWNNIGSNQVIVSRWNDASENNRSITLRMTTAGNVELMWSTNGTDTPNAVSTKTVFNLGIANTQNISLAASLDVNNGASGRTTRFWYSLDSGENWAPLGDPVTTAGVTSIFAGTREWIVGARNIGAAGFFDGKIGRVNVYSGLDRSGDLIISPDYRIQPPGTSTFKDSKGNTWILNGAAAIKPEPVREIPDIWAAWPLGVFLPESPNRTVDGGVITRDVEAYDQLKVLRDDIGETRFVAQAGTLFTNLVANILDDAGVHNYVIEPSDLTLPIDREWEPGTHKLQIINDLLGAINYRSLYFDSYGVARGEKYYAPSETAPSHSYLDDNNSIYLADSLSHDMDLFNIANKWVLWVSEVDTELFAVYENTDPQSPTSSASRHRVITDFRREDPAIPDQASLQAKAKLLAQEASQVLEVIEVETRIMPNHGDRDVIEFRSNVLGVPSSMFSEHEWSFDLEAGSTMKHRIRKIVVI